MTDIPTDFLTRDEILNMDDVETVIVSVPEWGNRKVMLRAMTGTDEDRYDLELVRRRDKNGDVDLAGMRAFLLALCIVDPKTKQPLFTPADVDALGAKSAAAITRLSAIAQKFAEDKRERLKKDLPPTDGGAPVSA